MHKKTFISFAGPVLLASAVFMAGCTTPTGTVGKMSYFTEGVITDMQQAPLPDRLSEEILKER